jgi:hypothetical protein
VPVELGQPLVEARGGEEEVQAHRREEEAEFQVGQEDDAEVDRIDAEGDPQRQIRNLGVDLAHQFCILGRE